MRKIFDLEWVNCFFPHKGDEIRYYDPYFMRLTGTIWDIDEVD